MRKPGKMYKCGKFKWVKECNFDTQDILLQNRKYYRERFVKFYLNFISEKQMKEILDRKQLPQNLR